MQRAEPPKYSCRESAIYLLSRRDHGRNELAGKLKIKGYPEEDIEQTVTYCDQLGYLNDQRFAEGLVRQHILKCHGALRIRQELKQKQLDSEVIDVALQQQDVDWFELAKSAAEKKFGLITSAEPKLRAKQIRFLQYRGFSFDQIQYALQSGE